MDSDDHVSQDEFLQVMITVYMGTLEQKLNLTFRMFDFDRDMSIDRGDVKHILSYAPLFTEANMHTKENDIVQEIEQPTI